MAYCSQDDLLKMIPLEELAEITSESGGTPDPAVVAEAIAKADSEIDSYCAVQYLVPFAPVPDRVRSLSVDIALYHLYSRRSVAPMVRRQKYEDAMAQLKAIAQGTAVLNIAGNPATATGREVSELASETRVFSRTTQGRW
ncbi:MAG: gp436 family protein [Desulfobacteraceae bacterium]